MSVTRQVLAGTPAGVRVRAFTSDSNQQVLAGAPAGVLTFVAVEGSLFLPYAGSESDTQALDFSIVPTLPETTAPAVQDGDESSHSLWSVFTSSGSQNLDVTVTASFAVGTEIFTGEVGDGPDALSLVEAGGASLTDVPVSAGQRVYIRVYPLDDANNSGSGSVTWSVSARPETGNLDFQAADEILETPGWLAVNVASATPLATLEFTLDGSGTPVFTADLDDLGLFNGGVLLPVLTVGSHTITATDTTSGQTGTQTFEVLLEPDDPGSEEDTPTAPTTGDRWFFYDPAPGGETYEFEINPDRMSSPIKPRFIETEATVYVGGQTIIWEGAGTATSWQIQGTVRTQSQYEAFDRFYNLNRRFWVGDHHGRGWVITWDSLDWQKIGSPGDVWAHSYAAKFLLLGGPVIL